MNLSPCCIGIDLDNTLVCYDKLFYDLAYAQKLIPSSVAPAKQAVRGYLRAHAGEKTWQALQSLAYGSCMERATLFPQAHATLTAWKQQGHRLAIISHKTRFSALDSSVNLHESALQFLEQEGILPLLAPQDIFFLPDRAAKITQLAALPCTLFIDDLVEIFSDPLFPPSMGKILFDPHGLHPNATVLTCHSWQDVYARSDEFL